MANSEYEEEDGEEFTNNTPVILRNAEEAVEEDADSVMSNVTNDIAALLALAAPSIEAEDVEVDGEEDVVPPFPGQGEQNYESCSDDGDDEAEESSVDAQVDPIPRKHIHTPHPPAVLNRGETLLRTTTLPNYQPQIMFARDAFNAQQRKRHKVEGVDGANEDSDNDQDNGHDKSTTPKSPAWH